MKNIFRLFHFNPSPLLTNQPSERVQELLDKAVQLAPHSGSEAVERVINYIASDLECVTGHPMKWKPAPARPEPVVPVYRYNETDEELEEDESHDN